MVRPGNGGPLCLLEWGGRDCVLPSSATPSVVRSLPDRPHRFPRLWGIRNGIGIKFLVFSR
jgi:hypothetical protein